MMGMNSRVGQQSPEVSDVRRWGYQILVAEGLSLLVL